MTYDKLMESILAAQEEFLKHKIEANSVTLNGRKYGKLIENCPPNMKPTIFGMAVKAEYTMPDDYDFLVQYEPPKPMTNADRIRAMSDEELLDVMLKEICILTGNEQYCGGDFCGDCKDCLWEWLKQEATE